MALAIKQTSDQSFIQDVKQANKPLLVYFHDAQDDMCEFTALLLESYARDAVDGPDVVFADRKDMPKTVDLLSVPGGPVMLMIRNQTVLGYKTEKLNRDGLASWVTRTLDKADADGIKLDELVDTLNTKVEKQNQTQQQAMTRARRAFMTSAAIKVGGGLALTNIFPLTDSWIGFMGMGIAGYNAFRGFQVYGDTQQAPLAPKNMPGKCLNAFMDAASWVGGFTMLGVAFNVASGMNFAAALGVGSYMMLNGSIGLGRLLPGELLKSSLKRDAQALAQRDPTKPLDEYSPPAPKP